MNILNQELSVLPFKLNLSNFIWDIAIDTLIYIGIIWAIVYFTHKYDASFVRKPAITIYTILSLFFISAIKFLILSVAVLSVVYFICIYV